MKLRKEELRVLLVDWSLSYLADLKSELEDKGFKNITGCNDGESAIRHIDEFEPHILLVDQEVKYNDGLSILQYVKEQELEIAVIFTSSCASEMLFRKANMLGVKLIIAKPTSIEVITERIEDIYQMIEFRKVEEEMIQEYAMEKEYELEEDPLELIDEIGLENNIGRILLGFGIRAN
ncbi:MAG: response regulator, partial [Clostridium sp.]|nr:response regulator [Clostridium sp.]